MHEQLIKNNTTFEHITTHCSCLLRWQVSKILRCYFFFYRPLTFRVRRVASTVQNGFFPYLVQMINSMRGCVACDDLWPWPISSRSFGLDLENRVRSVASTVLDGFFLYLAQIITIIRGCVVCYVFFIIWKFNWIFFGLTFEKNLQFLMDSFHI